MNEKMVVFIICTNDNTYLNECIYYIEHLNVPQDFMIDIITITDAEYMTGAYNAAMRASDAKYKVYLHQDVFIINRNFIADMLEVFADEQVGMIGMLGCDQYPKDARFSSAWNVGNAMACDSLQSFPIPYDTESGQNKEVVAIDGMLMATQYDIEWNENVQGWHFYDASQSIEFTEKGLKVVVPWQETPWVLHDAGWCSMLQYDKYRHIFCELYQNLGFDYELPDNSGHQVMPDNFFDQKSKVFDFINQGKLYDAIHLVETILKVYREDTDIALLMILFNIYKNEIASEGRSNIFASLNWSEIKNSYIVIKFLLRRIEYGFEFSEYQEIISLLLSKKVSFSYVNSVIEHSIFYQKRVMEELILRCEEYNNTIIQWDRPFLW